jgi:hypothetical protein
MFGLKSTQEQLADFRDAADSGVAMVLVDVCLGSYLQDHHNRDGECLFGVYVDGRTTVREVRDMLKDEVRSTGDRIDESVSDEAIAAAIDSVFLPDKLDLIFDSSLESPELDEDDEPLEEFDGESCQAWFVLTWPTPDDEEDS